MADFEIRNEDERAVYLAAFQDWQQEDSTPEATLSRCRMQVLAFRAAHPDGLPMAPSEDIQVGGRGMDPVTVAAEYRGRIRAEERHMLLAEWDELRTQRGTQRVSATFLNGREAGIAHERNRCREVVRTSAGGGSADMLRETILRRLEEP